MVLVTKTKPKKAPHHKRRVGHHHKKDERYTKAYWPYIPLVIIVTTGLVFSNIWSAVQAGVLSYATNTSISGLLAGTNTQRASNGLGGLNNNTQLNQAAQAKANDMVARNYWSHNTPDGQAPWVFISNAGYAYQTAGENLAYGFADSDATITGWMNSEGHRANILNSSYKEVGFGFANSADFTGAGEQTVVVAMYASPQPAAAPAPVAAAPAPKPAAPTPAPAEQPAAPVEQPKEEEKPKEVVAVTKDDKPLTAASSQPVETQNVSRVQLLTNGAAPWSMAVLTLLALSALAIFVLRHGLFWHRALVKGERFIVKHPVFDVAVVVVAVVGFVLTRTVGVIH